jgi:hypothetical protein
MEEITSFLKELPRICMSNDSKTREMMRSKIAKFSTSSSFINGGGFVCLLAISFESEEKEANEALRNMSPDEERDRVTLDSLMERVESFASLLDVKISFALRATCSLLRENPKLICSRVLKSLGAVSILPRRYREGRRDVPKVSMKICQEASEVLRRLGTYVRNIDELIANCQDDVLTMHALSEIVRGCTTTTNKISQDTIVNVLSSSSSSTYEAMQVFIHYFNNIFRNNNSNLSRNNIIRVILICISYLATEKRLLDQDTIRKEFYEEQDRDDLVNTLSSSSSKETVESNSIEILTLLQSKNIISRYFKRFLPFIMIPSDKDDDTTQPPHQHHLTLVWLVLHSDETAFNQDILKIVIPSLLQLISSIHTSRVVLGVVGLSSVIRKITPTELRWHGMSVSETLLKSLWNKDAIALEPLVQCTLRVVVALGDDDAGTRLQDRIAERLISTLRLSDKADIQTLYIRAVQPLVILMGPRVATHFSNLMPLLCAAASRESYGIRDRHNVQLEALRSIRCTIRACPIRVFRRHRRKCIVVAAKAYYQENGIDSIRNEAVALCRDLNSESELKKSGLMEMLLK